jgi:LemA protein
MGLYTGIGIIIVVALAAWAAIMFNRLVRARQMANEGWSGIDVQLKRRHDLIPNIVEAVKGYSGHERGTFENVAQTRSGVLQSSNPQERAGGENALTQTIKSMFAVAESYPELKASDNFLSLHKALVEVEDNIQYARRYYNGAVRNMNILVEQFPSNIVANIGGFKRMEFFEVELSTERQAVQINLDGAAPGGGTNA